MAITGIEQRRTPERRTSRPNIVMRTKTMSKAAQKTLTMSLLKTSPMAEVSLFIRAMSQPELFLSK